MDKIIMLGTGAGSAIKFYNACFALQKDNEYMLIDGVGGIILCSSKDKDVVEYSLSKNMSQTLISEYKLKLIDKKLLETKLSEMKKLLEKDDNY